MFEHLNHHHLGADLRAISAEIMALKRVLRGKLVAAHGRRAT
jgi:hypothetical protein